MLEIKCVVLTLKWVTKSLVLRKSEATTVPKTPPKSSFYIDPVGVRTLDLGKPLEHEARILYYIMFYEAFI